MNNEIVIDENFIIENSQNEHIIKIIQDEFDSLAKINAIQLCELLLQQKHNINYKDINDNSEWFEKNKTLFNNDILDNKFILSLRAKIINYFNTTLDINFINYKNKILELIASNNKKRATELMTKHFLKNNNVWSIMNDKFTEMYIYQDGIIVEDGKSHINEYCRTILGEAYKVPLANEVIAKIEADTYISQDILFRDEDVNLIPVLNGIYDIKNNKLLSFSPKYRFFYKLPVKYDKKATCPHAQKFFKDILKNENDIKIIQELFGYLLLRDYKIEKAFMLTGGGRNGKGKTLELMKRLIGVENTTNKSLQSIETEQFAVSNLFKKLANLSADISKTALRETGTFKSLTGHDLLSAPRKFKSDIKFINYAKMIFCANELPITNDITTAFFDRWILINFPFTFLPQDEIDRIPKNDRENIKPRDETIIDKISTPDELSGILNWSIIGLTRLLKQGNFSYCYSTAEVKKDWLRASSSVNAFIQDNIIEEYDGYITKNDFRKEYARYCRQFKLKIESDITIKNILSKIGAGDDLKSIDGDRQRIWTGIEFKEANNKKVQMMALLEKSGEYNEI